MKNVAGSLYFDFIDPKIPNSNEINKKISSHLEKIVERTKNNLYSVDGVYLTGGYSRSEGTVLWDNDKIEFISDYDIFVNTKHFKLLNQIKCEKIKRILEEELGIPIEISVLPTNLPKRIVYYELIEEGLCIYGKDNLIKHRFSADQIDKYDGTRLLFNRMQGLAVAVGEEFPQNPSSEKWKNIIIKECSKGFLAIAESLLLLSNKYTPTYRERNKLFSDVFKKEFISLYEQMPDLIYYVDLATRWKLDPRTNYEIAPIQLWFKVKDYMINTLGYYIKTIYGIESSQDTAILIENLLKDRKYDKKWTNLKYFTLKFLNEGRIMPKVIFTFPPITIRMKLSAFYTLDSISMDGRIDKHKFKRALDMIDFLDSDITGLKSRCDMNAWKSVIDFFKKNYSYA